MRVLVTGSAGFIGHALSRRLLSDGHTVIGFDGFSAFYETDLKRARHAELAAFPSFDPVDARLETPGALLDTVACHKPEIVVHLAAQAGVRYSVENPRSYVDANLIGTANLLEALRAHPVSHLLLASTSSAYGADARAPFRELDRAVTPISFYAATKLATEAMAHSYAHLFGVPTTALRFFTVYGPWGRPDMALFLFTKKILAGEPIEVFSGGTAERDFTYVDDLVEALVRLIPCAPTKPGEGEPVCSTDTLSPVAPYRLVNIGAGRPVRLDQMIDTLERALDLAAKRVPLPLPPGDVASTGASTELLRALIGTVPETPIEVGVPAFVRWYRDFYREDPSACAQERRQR